MLSMIDRDARDRLALALRRLASGQSTNDEFCDQTYAESFRRSDGAAISELVTFGWVHQDDLRTYRSRGRDALTREERRGIAQAVMFLKTDQQYVHGDASKSIAFPGEMELVLGVIVLLLAIFAGVLSYFTLGTIW